MTPQEIKQIIYNTPHGIERASKAEELLNTYKEELKGKKIDGDDAIGWVIRMIIWSTPSGIDRAAKAEGLLNTYKEELRGENDAIGWVIREMMDNTPSEDRAKKAEELLNKHIEDLKGKTIYADCRTQDAIGWVIKAIIAKTPEVIERAAKAEELLNTYKEELKGKTIYADCRAQDAIGWLVDKCLNDQELLIRSKVEKVLVGMKYSADQISKVITSDEFIKEIKKFSKLLDKQGYSKGDKKKYIEGGFKDSPLYKPFKDLIKMILNIFLNKENRYVYGSEYEIKSFSERVAKDIKPQVQQVL
jgi:hypothetical protein